MNHLCSLEQFIIGEDKKILDSIKFYGNHFNYEKLKLHRDMLIDIAESKQIKMNNTQDAIDFLKLDCSLRNMLSEMNKLIKIIFIIPVSSCTAERSFLALQCLKTFLRSIMSRESRSLE